MGFFVRPTTMLGQTYGNEQRPELGVVSDKIWINWGKEEEGKIELEVLADLFEMAEPSRLLK